MEDKEDSMGAVLLITSGKGGVGKSTLTTGVGSALARRGRRVLLIDGDAGLSCLDHMLGVAQERVYDLSDVISGGAELGQAVYPCPWQENLFLLAAPSREEDLVSPDVMKQLVRALARFYDHVLIDCPAGIGAGFFSAAAGADRALVVSTPDPVCLRNSAKTRTALEKAGITQQRLVVNRFSGAAFRSQGVFPSLDDVIDAVGVRLIAVIPEDPGLAAATAGGVGFPQKSQGAMARERLAARLEGEQIPLASLRRF